MDPPTPQIPSIYKAPSTELQPSRKSFLVATSALNEGEKVEKDEENESQTDKISMSIFSQTVHAFAEAFTAHGVHYIFERGQNMASRMFWVIIVVIAFLCSCLMLERYIIYCSERALLSALLSSARLFVLKPA